MDEEFLPQEIRAKAKITPGGEHAWRKEDFAVVVLAARRAGLASIGGQVQFIFPDGTCELYWVNYDSEEQKPDETWSAYVERSAEEVLKSFDLVCASTDFEKEAGRWPFIREKIEKEKINPLDYLWFVGYFNAEKAS